MNCKHTTHTTTTRAYTGTSPGTDDDRRAHGGVTHIDRCVRCNAVRYTDSNGGYSDVGRWLRDDIFEDQAWCIEEASR